jgi:hypothetical protein
VVGSQETPPLDVSGVSLNRDKFAGLGWDKDETAAQADARRKGRHPGRRVLRAQHRLPFDLANRAGLHRTSPATMLAPFAQADKPVAGRTKDNVIHP